MVNPLRERMEGDIPLPDRKTVEAIIARIHPNGGALDPEDLAELIEAADFALHVLPPGLDFLDCITRNPLQQVWFRAGLLACREYMARFVEQGGDATTAQSIRVNWWPILGDDPGAPRLFHSDEVAEEIEKPEGGTSIRSKEVSPSLEALPRAYQFLQSIGSTVADRTMIPPADTRNPLTT